MISRLMQAAQAYKQARAREQQLEAAAEWVFGPDVSDALKQQHAAVQATETELLEAAAEAEYAGEAAADQGASMPDDGEGTAACVGCLNGCPFCEADA